MLEYIIGCLALFRAGKNSLYIDAGVGGDLFWAGNPEVQESTYGWTKEEAMTRYIVSSFDHLYGTSNELDPYREVIRHECEALAPSIIPMEHSSE
jgi:hypothetical protein